MRQLTALLRMELLALPRNKTASAMSVVAPLAIGVVLAGEYDGGAAAGVTRMASVLALVVVFVVHHHLITGVCLAPAGTDAQAALHPARARVGAAVMAAFSAALSAVTRSSEAALLTSVPTVALFLATPGAMVPLGTFPEGVEAVARHLPLGRSPK